AYAITLKNDTIPLIRINKWDFRWQYFYTFKKMQVLPKGSTIFIEGVYDNTRKNPNNPFSPPQQIAEREGSMRTTDEMFQFIVTYLPYRSGDEDMSLEVENIQK
nr:cytochrome c [Bacteroidota bacterium]